MAGKTEVVPPSGKDYLIMTKNTSAHGTTLLAFSATDPHHIILGIPEISESTVLEYMETILPQMSSLNKRQPPMALEQCKVEFVPMCAGAGEKNASTDEKLSFLKKKLENPSLIDKAWVDAKMGWTVYTGALLVNFCGERSRWLQKDLRLEHMVPENVVRKIQNLLESKYGKGCAFVSKQIVPVETFLERGHEFFEQAYSRLVTDVRYWKHIYDTQEHVAGEFYIPLYAIPVSVLKKWGRIIAYSEHQEFISSIGSELMPRPDMNKLVAQIRDDSLILVPAICGSGKLSRIVQCYFTQAVSMDKDTSVLAESTKEGRGKRTINTLATVLRKNRS